MKKRSIITLGVIVVSSVVGLVLATLKPVKAVEKYRRRNYADPSDLTNASSLLSQTINWADF